MEKNKREAENLDLGKQFTTSPVSAISQVIKTLGLPKKLTGKDSFGGQTSLAAISLKYLSADSADFALGKLKHQSFNPRLAKTESISKRGTSTAQRANIDSAVTRSPKTELDSPIKKKTLLNKDSTKAQGLKLTSSSQSALALPKGQTKVLYKLKKENGLAKQDDNTTKIEFSPARRAKKRSNVDLHKSELAQLGLNQGLEHKSAAADNTLSALRSGKATTLVGNKKHIIVRKKSLTSENLSVELHKYRLDTDSIYRRQRKSLKELRPIPERKLNSKTFGLYPVNADNTRKTLGCLGVHPHNYDSLLGYRKGIPIVNNQKTLEGVRRVLNYLTKITQSEGYTGDKKMELLVIIDNIPTLDTTEGQNNYLSLLTLTIARVRPLNNLILIPKTMKEAIRYLTSKPTIPYAAEGTSSTNLTNPENLCGVLMINPAKSKLSELANLVFSKNTTGKGKQSSDSSLGAIGSLCAKKGLPLISLCDLSSPLTYSTYPIICNTRNLSEVYLVLDLLSYGLNQASKNSNSNLNPESL